MFQNDPNDESFITCEVYFKIYALTKVDTKNNGFDCDFLVALDWYDPKVASIVKGGGKPDFKNDDQLFYPKIEVQNIRTSIPNALEHVGGVSEPRTGNSKIGHVKITQRFRASLLARFCLEDYPFDQQLLSIPIKLRHRNMRKLRNIYLVHPGTLGLRPLEPNCTGHAIDVAGIFVLSWSVVRVTGVVPMRADIYALAIQ
eukprot:gene26180-32077_t